MNIKAVLFDLDGTLLPMDQDRFIQAYFHLLAKKMAGFGYEPKRFMDGFWHAISAMLKNDGSRTNEEAFWQTFTAQLGNGAVSDPSIYEEFYRKEFLAAKDTCWFAPEAAEAVALVKEKGLRPILATNPLYPAIATQTRIRWAGLSPEDFELYSTYENFHYCKPNPDYYREVLEKLGLRPEECLMVGNDVKEDMVAAALGMKVFLLTDCLINTEGKDISCYPGGSYPQLMDCIRSL